METEKFDDFSKAKRVSLFRGSSLFGTCLGNPSFGH